MSRLLRFFCHVSFVLAAVGAATPSTASAQSMGVKGGLQFSTFRFDGATEAATTRRPDAVGGVFYLFGNHRVKGQLEGLLGRKGARTKANGSRIDARILYFEIPLLLRINMVDRPQHSVFISGGGGLAARWASSTVTDGVSEDSRVTTKHHDLEWIVGGGFTHDHLIFEGRYTRGLMNVDPTKDAVVKITNDSVSVTAGYQF